MLTNSALELQGVMLTEDAPEAADKGASPHVPLHSHLPCVQSHNTQSIPASGLHAAHYLLEQ